MKRFIEGEDPSQATLLPASSAADILDSIQPFAQAHYDIGQPAPAESAVLRRCAATTSALRMAEDRGELAVAIKAAVQAGVVDQALRQYLENAAAGYVSAPYEH